MCGVAGIFTFENNINEYQHNIHSIIRSLHHRGPDYSQVVTIDNHCVLGHTRLKIIDLSDNANQPMACYQNRLFIVFNGEIYNYRELRTELQRVQYKSPFPPYPFKTHSDTEVILAAYYRWGKDCVKYLDGMFAFAIYDKQNQHLFIARDRQGKKPLYYIYNKKYFAFSSEIGALLQSDLSEKKFNASQLYDYCQYQTTFAPHTLVQDIQLLPSAHLIYLENNYLQIQKYWTPSIQNIDADIDVVKKEVRTLLFQAVEKRLISDVPLGAFLSGGIDSSAIVGIMKQIKNDVATFHITTSDKNFSEKEYADLLAKQYQTKHQNIVLEEKNILNDVNEALEKMDYPTGDGINTYIVSKATKNAGITVALSGLGGDELFAGYPQFKILNKLHSLDIVDFPEMRNLLKKILPDNLFNNAYRLKILLQSSSLKIQDVFPNYRKAFQDNKLPIKNNNISFLNKLKEYEHLINEEKKLSFISLLEMRNYMEHTLLRDTDQMSMANALEVRNPFLDTSLVEYVLSLSDEIKYPYTPKKLLTESISDILPKNIIQRKKMGFVLPFQNWMRKELKTFCENKLNAFSNNTFVEKEFLLNEWKKYLAGKHNRWWMFWHIIVLEYWLQKMKVNID